MYYKVVQDGVILDVWESPQFVKYKERHKAFVLCDASEADGVVLPSGTDIWMLDTSTYEIDGKTVIRLTEITEEEYTELKAQIEESGGGIVEPEPETTDPEEDAGEETDGEDDEGEGDAETGEEETEAKTETVLTMAEMSVAVKALQEENAELKEQNAVLEGCLLEMSEIVYA